MQNICGRCGGGYGQYTAPEARCKCATADRKQEFRHNLAKVEADWLLSCGWEPLEPISTLDGYSWKAPVVYGNFSPISQIVAIEIQKRLEKATMHPLKDSWLMGVTTTKLIEAVHDNEKVTKMRIAEMNLQRALKI